MSATEIKQFDHITGIFKPKNMETLKAEARPFIGESFKCIAAWIIEEGQHEGQWALQVVSPKTPCSWIPEEDLEINGTWKRAQP